MNPPAILFLIFGIALLITGLIIKSERNVFIARMYHKPTDAERKTISNILFVIGALICVLSLIFGWI